MGKKGGKKAKASGFEALGDMASELFKTLPPIKRAELNKVVEKLIEICFFRASILKKQRYFVDSMF